MLSRLNGIFLLAVSVVLISVAGFAQTNAELSGVVTDESGAVVPKAQITVTNTDTGADRSVTSDDKGRYVAPQLPPGSYQVSVNAPGFESLIRKGITLTVGQGAVLNLAMKVGAVSEQVTVTADAPLVNTSSSSVSGVVEEKRIEELPLNGRDFTQLALVEAGVVSARNTDSTTTKGFGTRLVMAGSRADQTTWLLDGTNIKSMANLGTPGSASGVMLGVDAIREFQVLTSNYSAEFGGTSGGVINLVSKSGTNQYHGSAYEFLRNDNVDARNFFDRDKAEFKRNQFGASFGGPIRKDKAFFFGNWEGLRERLGLTRVPAVPDVNAHNGILPGSATAVPIAPSTKPFLDLWPLPNGAPILNQNGTPSGFGQDFFPANQTTNENYVVARGDYRMNDKQALFSRFTLDQGDKSAPDDLPLVNTAAVTRTRYVTLQHDFVISPLFLATTRIAYNRTLLGSNVVLNATFPANLYLFSKRIAPSITFPGIGTAILGPNDRNLLHTAQNLYQIDENLIYTHGAHTMKFGFDFQKNDLNSDPGGREGGSISYASISDFLQDKTLQTLTVGVPGSSAQRSWRQQVYAGYFQDDWKLRSNLIVNLGVRYEPFSVPTEKWGRIAVIKDWVTATQFQTNVPYWNNPSKKNFAPRVGFAWDPSGNGKTAVRGGFGLFFVDLMGGFYRAIGSRDPPFYALVQNSLGGNLATAPADVARVGPTLLTPILNPQTFFQIAQYNLNPSYEMKMNLAVERELPGNMSVSLGYIGGRGFHLWRILSANAIPSTFIGDREFVAPPPPGTLTVDPRRINKNVGTGSINYSDAQSFYNGMQLSVKKRLSRGLQIQGSYNWSKNIDDSTTGILATDYLEGDSSRPYNKNADRGLSALNVSQNFVFNGLYSLPAPHNLGFASKLFEGWQVSGIFTASSGVPFSTTVSGYNALDLTRTAGGQRPDLVAGTKPSSLIIGDPNHYFDTSGFVQAAPNFYGNAGRNILIGPGLENFDFSLAKSTPLHLNEGSHLDFRADFFNLLNRANFKNPLAVVFNASNRQAVGTAGRISATSTPSRELQFSLRLVF